MQLKAHVLSHAVKEEDVRLMGKDTQKYIHNTFGVNYEIRNNYRLMKQLGIFWITSRSKPLKQGLVTQEAFKKILD